MLTLTLKTVNRPVPVVEAYPVVTNNGIHLAAWCKHCRELHLHPYREGHHSAACGDETPFTSTGYRLKIPRQSGVEHVKQQVA